MVKRLDETLLHQGFPLGMTDSGMKNTPKDIGNLLKDLREKQGLSLEELSRATNISQDMLNALESGCWERFGTRFLVKSFVKSYCRALNTSCSNLLKVIDEIAETYRCDEHYRAIFARQRPGKRNIAKILFYTVIICICLALAIGSVYTYRLKSKKRQPPPDLVSQPEVKIPENIVLQKKPTRTIALAPLERKLSTGRGPHNTLSESGPATIPMNLPEAGSKTLRPKHHDLVIKAIEKAWVKVWPDNNQPISKLLKRGEELKVTVEKSAKIITGNAGGTQLVWDGTVLPPPGKRGQVVRLTLPMKTEKKPVP